MTYNEAIEFLKAHQPMPNTQIHYEDEKKNRELENLLTTWCNVLEYFMDNPCEESIPLFLNSLGDCDGLSCYQGLVHYVEKFPPDIIIPYFKDAFCSPSEMIRSVAADYALNIDSGSSDLIEAMLPLLNDLDDEVRLGTISTLFAKADEGLYDWRKYEDIFMQNYNKETDSDIKEMYEELFEV